LSSNLGEVLTMFVGVIAAGTIGLEAVDGAFASPLLATQILWVNLLTDSAPALALGFDPPPPDVMRRPPRRIDQRIVDREMQLGLLFVGLTMAAITLFSIDLKLPGGLVAGSGSLDEARTLGFTVLVLAQLFNALNARSQRASAFSGLFHNPRLFGALALSLVLQLAVVHIGVLGAAFGTVPLSLSDWLLATGLASCVLWLVELEKLVIRAVFSRRGRGPVVDASLRHGHAGDHDR
jgi:Ca2+-transporting ATPase